jgi:hypothetical protein
MRGQCLVIPECLYREYDFSQRFVIPVLKAPTVGGFNREYGFFGDGVERNLYGIILIRLIIIILFVER